MYCGKKVAVIITAYNEELLIEKTIVTVPKFVDHIVVVNDCSTDRTEDIVSKLCVDRRVVLINRLENGGVGAAMRTGFLWCRENGLDLTAVMNGDAQMDPCELPLLLNPLVIGTADFTKGNRLIHPDASNIIPFVRYIGNKALSFLTKFASGYWHVSDSQTGYTAMNKRCLEQLPFEELYPRYGVPNDLLVMLNIHRMRVLDVPIKPIYGVGEKSEMKISRLVFSLSYLLVRLFIKRTLSRYVVNGLSIIALLYLVSTILFIANISTMLITSISIAISGMQEYTVLESLMYSSIIGVGALLLAIYLDMKHNTDNQYLQDSYYEKINYNYNLPIIDQ